MGRMGRQLPEVPFVREQSLDFWQTATLSVPICPPRLKRYLDSVGADQADAAPAADVATLLGGAAFLGKRGAERLRASASLGDSPCTTSQGQPRRSALSVQAGSKVQRSSKKSASGFMDSRRADLGLVDRRRLAEARLAAAVPLPCQAALDQPGEDRRPRDAEVEQRRLDGLVDNSWGGGRTASSTPAARRASSSSLIWGISLV